MSRTVGLTGGIASGKSTVARYFRELGVPVIDADAIAREVVRPGSPAFEDIVAWLGASVLDGAGEIDRKRLGALVFADAGSLKRLNEITHPRIGVRSGELLQAAHATAAPYAIYEAALLVENGLHRSMDAVVVVAVPREEQLRRLVKRDGLTEAEAESRVSAQLPLVAKTKVADFVIDTSGPYEVTQQKTADVHRALSARFGSER